MLVDGELKGADIKEEAENSTVIYVTFNYVANF